MHNFSHKIMNNRVVLVCLVLLLGCLAHACMLTGTFKTLDDSVSILNNPDIKDFGNTGKVFRSSFFGGRHYYRPLVSLSYMLEYHFFGLRSFYFNLTNLALHLAIAVTVFFLVLKILKDNTTAFFASLLFAVHPVQWEAVANIPGRAVVLSTFFTVNALFFYTLGNYKMSESGENRPKIIAKRFSRCLSRRKRWFGICYGVSLVCFACGLLAKESAAMMPVLILAYIFLVEKDPKRARQTVPYFLIILVYLCLRWALGITATFPWRSANEFVLGFLTFLRACLTYLRLFVWPVDLHFDRAREMFTTYRDPQLWMAVLLFAAAGFALFRSRRRLAAPAVFFLAWFVIELFPVSQIVTTIGVGPGYISTAEHFLYMPAIGIFVLLALSGKKLYHFGQSRKNRLCSPGVWRFTLAGFFLFLILITARQGLTARTTQTMFRESLARNPHNTRILYSMGIEMANRGRFVEAEQYFRRALEGEPLHLNARIALGRALYDQGRIFDGIAVYEQVRASGRENQLLKDNLEEAYRAAVRRYEQWIAATPGNARLHYSLGTVYSRSDRIVDGIVQYKQAVAIDPQHTNALFNMASSYEALGHRDKAVPYYQRVIAIEGEEGELGKYARERLGEIVP